MTDDDDLLDEATRFFENHPAGPIVRALVERVRAAEAEAISLRSIVTHETQMREDAEARAVTLSETRTRLLAKHPHTLCQLQREEVEDERDEARGKLDALTASLQGDVDQIKAETSEEPARKPDSLDDLLGIDPNNLTDRLAATAVQYMHQRHALARTLRAVREWHDQNRAAMEEDHEHLSSSDVRWAYLDDVLAILDGKPD